MAKAFDIKKIARGARVRRSPYFAATQRYGCQGYTVYNHMYLPNGYSDPVSEYWKLVRDVTLWDVSVERIVEISGPGGFALASKITPRDLEKCQVGQAKYVLITDENGGIINDPVLLRFGENHFWLALADSDVLLWAKAVALGSGLKADVREIDVFPLQVQGPKSKGLMGDLFGAKILTLPYYYFVETALDGIPLVITRTGWTGEIGYELYLREPSRGVELWEKIMRAGRKYKIAPTGPCDIRRIEAGILNLGADMTLMDNPYEVGLGWLVDLAKRGDFIGKAALSRIRTEGVKRKLMGLEIAGRPIEFNMTRWPVGREGRDIGYLTSAIHSPRLKKNIGYAMLPIENAAPGTKVTVAVPGTKGRAATVVEKPFIDPKKDIPKS